MWRLVAVNSPAVRSIPRTRRNRSVLARPILRRLCKVRFSVAQGAFIEELSNVFASCTDRIDISGAYISAVECAITATH